VPRPRIDLVAAAPPVAATDPATVDYGTLLTEILAAHGNVMTPEAMAELQARLGDNVGFGRGGGSSIGVGGGGAAGEVERTSGVAASAMAGHRVADEATGDAAGHIPRAFALDALAAVGAAAALQRAQAAEASAAPRVALAKRMKTRGSGDKKE
jgi:hypothetical protein